MTKCLKNKLLIILLGLASLSAIIMAYISQYIFLYQPCQLCLYQRVPFFIVIGLSILSLFLQKNNFLQIILYFCIAILLINFAIAFYHVGVEYKIFSGFSSCSGNSNLNKIDNLYDLQQALTKQPMVKCDEPQFYFLGLTMAFWNMIYCLILASCAITIRLKKS